MTEKHPVAPASGVRIKGKTYLPGQRLPKQYGRISENGQLSLDPARGVGDAPPNFGRDVLPSILSFSGRSSVVSHVYKNPDVAYTEGGVASIRAMRNDCSIMECLEARQRGTALLNWHLEPEDKKDPKQKQLADDLTDILQATPDFTEYRRCLLEAIWYGRYAVQHAYGWQVIKGNRRCVVTRWSPINGDKLVFRYDDGTGKYSGDEIGIKVGLAYGRADKIAGDRKIEMTDQGPCYFLEPWERSRLAIHKHIIEDGVYEDATSAGRIHGVGVRDRIYWTWFQQQNTMGQLMELIERTGNGITLYRYPDGNPKAQAEIEEIAKRNTNSNIIIMPSMPDFPDAYAIDRVEPSTAGITALKDILHEFFGWRIKRYIIGQIRSSEPVAGGLGTSDGDVQKDTLNQIVAYDAVKLEETLTREFVNTLKMFNFAWARDIAVKFVIDTESADAQRKLTAFKAAWDMGLKIKDSDVYDSIGASMPGADEPFLQNPQLAQQQPGAMPGGEGIQASDAFGPAMGDEGQDEGGGQPPPDDQPDQPKGPVQYAAALGADPRWKTHHQPGETMSRGAHTYVLNEHHRWERQDKDSDPAAHMADTIDANSTPKGPDEAGAMAKLGIDPKKPFTTGEQDRKKFADKMNPGQPLLEPSHEDRHAHVTKALGAVDPQASGLIRAFHEHPDYKSGGEVASQKLDPNHAQQLHSWLSQSAAKGDGPPIIMADGRKLKSSHVGGGIAVDFGDGRTGFASEAGSFVVGQDGKANYTSKTGIVSSAMGGKPMLKPQGTANAPPQANAAPQAGPAGPAASPAPQAAAGNQPVTAPGNQLPQQSGQNQAIPPVVGNQPVTNPVTAHETPSAAPNVTPPVNPHGDSPFAAGFNPHRENANKAHAEWQQAVQGMDAASKAGASGKDLAAWSRHVSSRRKIFREFEQAANHHDKANKPGKSNPAAKGPPTDEEILRERFGIGTKVPIAQGVDPNRPRLGSPEDIAAARQPRADEHAHHKALHETLSEAAANEPDDAKAASLAAQAVHHEALADHHSAALNPPSPSQQPGGSAEAQAAKANSANLRRNFTAGQNQGSIGFENELHRDLYDLGAKQAYGMKGGQNKPGDRPNSDTGAIAKQIADKHGVDAKMAHEMAGDVYRHGKGQMRGLQDGEHRDVKAPEFIHNQLSGDEAKSFNSARATPHSPAVHSAIQAAHEALHKSGLAEAPVGQGGYVPPSDEALAKLKGLGQKGEKKADPDAWKNSVKRRLVDADLHTHPRNVNAINEAIERGQIKSPEDLKSVLGTARDLAHGKNAIPDMEKDTHEAVRQALGRKARRKERAPTVKPEAMLAEGAKKHGIEPEEYADLADHVWQTEAMNSPNRKPEGYAGAVAALRKHTGFKSASAAQNDDEKELPDDLDMIFREHPELGVSPDASTQEQEDAAWDILKSDDDKGSGIPPKNSPEYWAFADDAIRQMKEHEAANPPSHEDEPVPFAARWRDGYEAKIYARKPIKSTKGQTTMFGTSHGIEGAGPATPYDEKKHSRGTGGAFREIGPKDDKGQGKLGFDESKHPREEKGGPKGGQFKHGDKIKIPSGLGNHTTGEFNGVLHDEGDDILGIRQEGKETGPLGSLTKIHKRQFPQFVDDLHGKISGPATAHHESVNAVLSGRGQFLGRGNDGLAFDAGDGNVVKASSDVPFHWNNGLRRHGEGRENLEKQVQTNESLRASGVPGLLRQELVNHEGRAYAVMPKVDTSKPLTKEHINQLAESIKAMHAHGYKFGDEVQAGVDDEGNAKIYDTGSVRKMGNTDTEKKWDKEDDEGHLRRLAEKHGHDFAGLEPKSDEPDPFSDAPDDEKPKDAFSLARPGEYQPPKAPPEEKPKPAKQDKMFHGMDALPGQQDLFEGLDKGGGDGSPKSVSVTSESHDKAEHVTDHAVYGMDDLPGQTKMFGGMDLGGREPLENEAKSGENDGMNESEVIAGYAAKVASGQMQHSSAKDKLKKKGIAEPGKKLAAAVEKLREGGNAKAKLDAMSKAKELAESGDVHRALIALNPKISKEVLEQSPGFYDDIEQFDGDTIEEKLNDAAHRGYHDTLDHEREQEAEAEEQRKIDDEREAAEKDEAERRSEPHVVANLKQRAEIAKHEIDRTNDRKEKRLYRADIQMPDAHAAMLKAGWKFEYQSKSGSMYYRKGDSQARLADHEVPATSEREHNKQHGGFSWSDADNQVILPVDDIGEAVRGLDDDPPAPSPAVPKGPEPDSDPDTIAYNRHAAEMKAAGIATLPKAEWIARRDAILAKRKENLAGKEQAPAEEKPLWKTAKPRREGGQLGEISGLQASRTSGRELDRMNAKADARMGNVSSGLSGYSKGVIEAHERGEVDENTPGIHDDARMVIQDHKKRTADAAVKSAAVDVRKWNKIGHEELSPGMTVYTGMGKDAYKVARVNEKSVSLQRADGSKVNLDKDDLLRVPHYDLQKVAMAIEAGESPPAEIIDKHPALKSMLHGDNPPKSAEAAGGKEKPVDLHPLAKAAGVKSVKDAHKKGLDTIVQNVEPAKSAALEALKSIATRLHSPQQANHIAEKFVTRAIEGAAMMGNADSGFKRAIDLIGNTSQTPDGDPLDLNVRDQFKLAAETLAKHKDAILGAFRGNAAKSDDLPPRTADTASN